MFIFCCCCCCCCSSSSLGAKLLCYKCLSWATTAGYWWHFCFTAWISVRRAAAESCLIIRVTWTGDWRLSELTDIRQQAAAVAHRCGSLLSISQSPDPIRIRRRRRRCDWSHKWDSEECLKPQPQPQLFCSLKVFFVWLLLVEAGDEIWYQSVECWECDTQHTINSALHCDCDRRAAAAAVLKEVLKRKEKSVWCCLQPTRTHNKQRTAAQHIHCPGGQWGQFSSCVWAQREATHTQQQFGTRFVLCWCAARCTAVTGPL